VHADKLKMGQRGSTMIWRRLTFASAWLVPGGRVRRSIGALAAYEWKPLLILAIVATIVKLLVTQHNGVSAQITRVDDDLFVRHAANIVSGKWLGSYNALTLIKGPGFPLWLALNDVLGFRFLVSEQLAYCIASALIVHSLRTFITYRFARGLLLLLLIFNPMSFDAEIMQQVNRDGFYMIVCMVLLACATELLAQRGDELWRATFWAALLSAFAGIAWITREESILLAPFLCIPVILFALNLRTGRESYASVLRFVGFSYAPFLAIVATVCCINQAQYGFFGITDGVAGSIAAAESAALSVRQTPYRPTVLVNRRAAESLYAVSPTYRSLRSAFEGHERRLFTQSSCVLFHDICDDIGGNWYLWAFRFAAADVGFYDRGPNEAARRFASIADEIRAACRRGRIRCTQERGLFPHFDYRSYRDVFDSFAALFSAVIRLEGFEPGPLADSRNDRLDTVRLFRTVTHEQTNQPRFQIARIVANVAPRTRPLRVRVFDLANRPVPFLNSPTSDHDIVLSANCPSACYLKVGSGRDSVTTVIGRAARRIRLQKLEVIRRHAIALTIEQNDFFGSMRDESRPARPSGLRLYASGYATLLECALIIAIASTLLRVRSPDRRFRFSAVEATVILIILIVGLRLATLSVINTFLCYVFQTRFLAPMYPLIVTLLFIECYRFGVVIVKTRATSARAVMKATGRIEIA